jgi:hypothetical protein
MAVSGLPERKSLERRRSREIMSWEGDAITVNDPSDLLGFMKNVIILARRSFGIV